MLGGFAAAALCLLLTPLLAAAARRAGWFDHPDGRRKTHHGPVAPAGGTAVLLAVLAGGWFGGIYGIPGVPQVMVAAGVIYAIGLIDDLRGMAPWTRLAIECAAAALAVGSGPWHFTPPAAAAVTAWLVLCTNAFNLLDGLDGLAASTAILAAAGMLLMHNGASGLLAVLAGALAGFLVFNLPPARVFLGDSGSLTVGLLLGAATLWSSRGAWSSGETLARWLPGACTLALPIADTGRVALRRWRGGRRIFQGDREHIHHRMRDLTGSSWKVLLLLSVFNAAVAAAAATVYRHIFR